MLNWVRNSFARQAGAAMLVTGLLLNLVYSSINYRKESELLRISAEEQARQLSRVLALLIRDELRYERYYDLWEKIDGVLHDPRAEVAEGRLFAIREIAVIDRQGLVAGHTDPRRHPLKTPYEGVAGRLFEPRRGASFSWRRSPPTLCVRIPVHLGQEEIGTVLLDLDTTGLVQHQRRLVVRAVLFQIVILVVIVLLAIGFGRWLGRPLGQAVEVLERIGRGDVELPGLARRNDEFRRLGHAIEEADRRIHADRRQLQEQREQLEASHQRLEERVRERTRELEEANRELSAFSYSVSHDLRSPLRAIDGFTRALEEDYRASLDETGRSHLHRIRAAVQRMGRLIDDMLRLSRVSRQEMREERFDLSAEAEAILARLAEETTGRRVRWRVEPEIVVRGDAKLLAILLHNLLENAWKYTMHEEEALIEVGVLTSDGERLLFVRDNGAGFDMRYADKLFGVFQRLHREEEFPGTGVGLAIVHRIVHRHGGRIWARGQPGSGATFYIALGERLL